MQEKKTGRFFLNTVYMLIAATNDNKMILTCGYKLFTNKINT